MISKPKQDLPIINGSYGCIIQTKKEEPKQETNNIMKQTAVDWLVEQMMRQGYFDSNKPLTFTDLDHLQHQAKEMEKKQIIDAWIVSDNPLQKMEAEKYYNITYKQD
jgi:hypothetical protein